MRLIFAFLLIVSTVHADSLVSDPNYTMLEDDCRYITVIDGEGFYTSEPDPDGAVNQDVSGLETGLHHFRVWAKNDAGHSEVAELLAFVDGWKEVRNYYSQDGLILYQCKNETANQPESETDWWCWKYYYDNSMVTRIQGPLQGAASNRENLGW